MKKFLNLCVCACIIALTAFAYNKANATDKMNVGAATTAMSVGVATRVRGAGKAGMIRELKYKYPKSVVYESEIKMEQYIKNGQVEYFFNFKQGTSDTQTENKLSQNDGFKVLEMGLFLYAEDKNVPGIGVLQTYPNDAIFPTSGTDFINQHLEHIYQGKGFVVKVGDTTYSEGTSVRACRVVPSTQQKAGAAGANFSENSPNDGFITSAEQFMLRGFGKTELSVKVAGSNSHKVEAPGSANVRYKLVLILRGFTITGEGAEEKR